MIVQLLHALGLLPETARVLDLGCGCGTFAIGAALLGAEQVIGIDIDDASIDCAKENAQKLNLDIEFKACDVKDFNEKGDCVVQNPPFGAQRQHADRPFLEKALELSDVVYSIHLTKTSDFIEKISNKLNADITHTKSYDFNIPHTFTFHSKEKMNFAVCMFRLEKTRV